MGLCCAPALAAAYPRNATIPFRYDEASQTYNLDVQSVPLGTVLEKISQHAHTFFLIEESDLETPVFAKFESLSLTEAMRHILREFSYVILEGEGGVREVITFRRNGAGARPPSATGDELQQQLKSMQQSKVEQEIAESWEMKDPPPPESGEPVWEMPDVPKMTPEEIGASFFAPPPPPEEGKEPPPPQAPAPTDAPPPPPPSQESNSAPPRSPGGMGIDMDGDPFN